MKKRREGKILAADVELRPQRQAQRRKIQGSSSCCVQRGRKKSLFGSGARICLCRMSYFSHPAPSHLQPVQPVGPVSQRRSASIPVWRKRPGSNKTWVACPSIAKLLSTQLLKTPSFTSSDNNRLTATTQPHLPRRGNFLNCPLLIVNYIATALKYSSQVSIALAAGRFSSVAVSPYCHPKLAVPRHNSPEAQTRSSAILQSGHHNTDTYTSTIESQWCWIAPVIWLLDELFF